MTHSGQALGLGLGPSPEDGIVGIIHDTVLGPPQYLLARDKTLCVQA